MAITRMSIQFRRASWVETARARVVTIDECVLVPASFLLSVGCVGAVLAEIMPIQQRLGNPVTALSQGRRKVGHARHRFQHGRMVGRLVRRFPPAERRVARYQDGWICMWIETLKTARNRDAGVEHVIAVNLLRG